MLTAEEALPGRPERAVLGSRAKHFVLGTPLEPPFPEGLEQAVFGMGCFWGAERKFWEAPGVYTTAVGYAGGFTPNPTYEEVCSGRTGHTEAVLVVFDPKVTSYDEMLDACSGRTTTRRRACARATTSARSTAPRSTRSATSRRRRSSASRADVPGAVERRATARSRPRSRPRPTFYYAEDYHQQYLAKNPNGYCGLGGTGVSCPIGVL